PNAMDSNPAWQAVNKAVGGTMKVLVVPYADYNTRFAAMTAANDLPEIFWVPAGSVQQLPDFLKNSCADLTEYLSGDAVKDYPNLANIPSYSWKSTLYNNAISGVPVGAAPVLYMFWAHGEMMDQLGLAMPKTADDLKKTMQAVVKAGNNQYGIGTTATFGVRGENGLFPSIYGAPNNWGVSNGKFTKDFETEPYKAAVSYARDLWSSGLFHPNSVNYNLVSQRADFFTRKFMYFADVATPSQIWEPALAQQPPVILRSVPPFSADGQAKPQYFFQPGYLGFTAIKKSSPDGIKQLLKVLNFMVAPFGSEEYLLLSYGVKGTDYNLDDNGNPILTAQGMKDGPMPWCSATGNTFAQVPPVLFDAKSQDFAPQVQAIQRQLSSVGVQDPSLGLYSATQASKAAVLNKAMTDGISDIVRGNRPLSDLDQLAKDWKSGGGDQIRTELEQALADSTK
ncbi:MAG: extracellular solute-binding protein, partial [Chloroflexi bacterium]|nr:extracellular solute-binding protein [Chloroflexota bacterium]